MTSEMSDINIDTRGELVQRSNETKVRWTIAGFSDLTAEPDEFYSSTCFTFSDALWNLEIYPNGQSSQPNSYVELYIIMVDGFSMSVSYAISLKKADGTSLKLSDSKNMFSVEKGWGLSKPFRRSDLLKRKSELLPSDVLTVQCTLKVEEDMPNMRVPLFQILTNVSRDLEEILTTEQSSDVVLKFGEEELKAHKAILGTRSKVFAAMLNHDMKERKSGEIKIEDTAANVFQIVLSYIYCGRVDIPEGLANENVHDVYIVADKYDLDELKKICVSYMVQNMSNDFFCDTLVIAYTYSETYLKEVAIKRFRDNSIHILESEEWKRFQLENSNIAAPFLTSILKMNSSKKKETSQTSGLEQTLKRKKMSE